MKTQARFYLLALPLLLLASCSPFNHTTTTKSDVEGNRTEYKIMLEKDASDYLEIVDVRLINSENMSGENATFNVVDTDGTTTLLNLRGYEKFYILARINDSSINPDRAIITYKDEPDGDQKSKVIEPLMLDAK